MMHAQIIDGTIVATRATPTGGAWEDDQWLDFTDAETLAAWEERHGYTLVVETPRPDDTDTTKHDESVVLVDGVPTQTWTARPWNADEIAAREARIQREATRTAVKAIITDLKAEKTRAQTVIDKTNATITGADTKEVARAAKRIADAAIDLARFVKDQ